MKTNRGKGYFYNLGQQHKRIYGDKLRIRAAKWPAWAHRAYSNGFHGFGL